MNTENSRQVETEVAGVTPDVTALTGETFAASPHARTEVDVPEAAKAVSHGLLKTHGEYRVAVAQITTDPGAIEKNTEKIIEYISHARSRGARLVVFPELAIPGYCSMDLLWNQEYLSANLAALQKVRAASAGITVIVGFVDVDIEKPRSGGRPTLYNSAAVIHDGKILGIQDKTLLPNYDIFFEDRYFSPPRSQRAIEAGGIRIGTEICEDLWTEGYTTNPTETLVKDGAELIVNLSASPFHMGKLPIRHELISSTASVHHVPFIYTNLVRSFDGFEGEVVFDGRSIVMGQSGELQALGSGFKEDLLIVDLYPEQKLELPEVEPVAELHDALVLGIRDYFRRVGAVEKANFKAAFIGLSGGIDSALVAALAVEALGKDKVIGVTMPSQYNSAETKSDAVLLAERLGIAIKTLPIQGQVDACLEALNQDQDLSERQGGVADENVQARLRMINLMYYANKMQGLVLNTGNKTELALDNCTIYGDMVGGFSVLGDVDKDRVYELSRYVNRKAGTDLIPVSTIDRVPSAELKPNQVDANVMGADPSVIAPLVRTIIQDGLSFSQALSRFSGEFDADLIRNTYRKLDRSEWKRRQAAPAIRVTSHAFGNGRRVPMSHGFIGEKAEE